MVRPITKARHSDCAPWIENEGAGGKLPPRPVSSELKWGYLESVDDDVQGARCPKYVSGLKNVIMAK